MCQRYLGLSELRVVASATKDGLPPREARAGFVWKLLPNGYWFEKRKKRRRDKRSQATNESGDSTATPSSVGQVSKKKTSGDGSHESIDSTERPPSTRRISLRWRSTRSGSEKGGLYSRSVKFLKELGRTPGPRAQPEIFLSDSDSAKSKTRMVLDETASLLRIVKERAGKGGGSTTASLTPSPTGEPRSSRRFDSLRRRKTAILSKSSSVIDLLMGKPPATTPRKEAFYEGSKRNDYFRVEISDPDGPTFLPSEATRVGTPPLSSDRLRDGRPRGFFFDYGSPGGVSFSDQSDSGSATPLGHPRPDRGESDERSTFHFRLDAHPEAFELNTLHRKIDNQTNDPHSIMATMATGDAAQPDPLLLLQQSIAANHAVIPTTSDDASAATDEKLTLATATHLLFTAPSQHSFKLDTPTRFISSEKAVDLRSIYFAWQKKDVAIPEYIASAQRLNEALAAEGGAGGQVQNLVFVERLDLITWLEGASEESECIKPLASEVEAARAASAAQHASGAAGAVASGAGTTASGRTGKPIDPRLAEIYKGERPMGDRYAVLRGIRPTNFSHVRKFAEVFSARSRDRAHKTGRPTAGPAQAAASASASASAHRKPSRRPDPIILLSPSASALLRMSNIKAFLEGGTFVPADSALAGSSNTANILHISRLLPSIDRSRAMRFILVETPEQFKPDYWQRVVAVFTTGQAWQFKSYKWQQPPELFRHVLGVYVGWRDDAVPGTVKAWGRGVVTTAIDKWYNQGVSRWRDREVVEGIWGNIEEFMKSRGWGAHGGPGAW
ncbi:MAG: accessory factor associated with RNA polymerase II [Phylliscum demangeonii]|nr:MAG: accessory factor associated with RNA polymerase II [Phylliscum demangeonii]